MSFSTTMPTSEGGFVGPAADAVDAAIVAADAVAFTLLDGILEGFGLVARRAGMSLRW